MMEDYLTGRSALKQVFMLIDFRHKPTADDIMMYNFLKHYKIPVTIVATKADKVGITLHQKQRNMILLDSEYLMKGNAKNPIMQIKIIIDSIDAIAF